MRKTRIIVVAALVTFACVVFFALKQPQQITKRAAPRTELTVLAVSDVHNNLEAMKKANDLVRRYRADLVLDAGDLTDFGSEGETAIVDAAGDLPVPHVFVTGNHDSTFTTGRLATLKNTYLPDERVLDVLGMRVLGQNDPASRAQSPHSVDPTPEQVRGSIRRLSAVLDRLPSRPDVIIAHEPAIAERFSGRAPLIVSGHVHQAYVRHKAGSVIVNPGTSGAAGIRYVTEGRVDKMTAALIRVTLSPKFAVRDVRIISIDTRTGRESVR